MQDLTYDKSTSPEDEEDYNIPAVEEEEEEEERKLLSKNQQKKLKEKIK